MEARVELTPFLPGSMAEMADTLGVSSHEIGRTADRKTPRFVVANAIAAMFVAFIVFCAVGERVWGLVIRVIVLDAGIQGAQPQLYCC